MPRWQGISPGNPTATRPAFAEQAALKRVVGRNSRLAFSPGSKFAYSNIGYWLLGAIVEQLSGDPFTSCVTNRVLRPLGIPAGELSYAIENPALHATGYLERWSFFNLVKRWLIDRDLIGEYQGSWLRIRD